MAREHLTDDVVQAVRRSKRYTRIDESVVRRIAGRAVESSRGRVADAIKRTKRQLHQIHGAYLDSVPRYGRLLDRVRAAEAEGPEPLRLELRRLMALHASTRERADSVDQFYGALFDRIGEVTSVLDIGCGLNPLAAPWMRLSPGCTYTAIDIDSELVAFDVACLEIFGVRAAGVVHDVVAQPPRQEADVALALKMLPCLDQQQRNAGLGVIRALCVPVVAVSFPVTSLGGRSKGMRENYAKAFEEQVRVERWDVEKVDVPGELLYVVRK
jgi:16S rRNA (guanine(1405)-N(7))-methyltransferase